MKLIIAGATGYVGTELIRQALSNPSVTSIVALGRRQTAVPDNLGPKADVAKFKPVVLEDFGKYPDDVKQQLAEADACVWLMAVTPTKSKAMTWDDVKRICLEYTVTGLNVLTDLPRGPGQKPLRFIYTSGSAATRDPAKKPFLLGDYAVMRGECENKVIEAQKAHPEELDIAIAKPGLITSPQRSGGYIVDKARDFMCSAISLPLIDLREMSAALLSLAVNGANGKETFVNDDLVATGKEFLAKEEPKPQNM